MINEQSTEIECVWEVRPGHLDRDRCLRMSASSHSSEWSEILGQERRPAVINPCYYSQSFFHECASLARAEYGMCLAQIDGLCDAYSENLILLVFRDVFVFWTLNTKRWKRTLSIRNANTESKYPSRKNICVYIDIVESWEWGLQGSRDITQ